MQDPQNRQNSPSGHHCTTLPAYIFASKARIDNRKKLLNSNVSPTCPYNMVNFGLLVAEIVSLVWGTPANVNGFRVLVALLHSTLFSKTILTDGVKINIQLSDLVGKIKK